MDESKRMLVFDFERQSGKPSLSVSKESYSKLPEAKENNPNRRAIPGKVPPRQKLSLDKDYLASEHPSKNARHFIRDFAVSSKPDWLQSPSMKSGLDVSTRNEKGDAHSVQKS